MNGHYSPDPEEQFWIEKSRYPRGFGPRWTGEDAPSEYGDPLYVDDEQTPDPDRYIIDPGFAEDELDAHYADYGPEENDWAHQRAYQD